MKEENMSKIAEEMVAWEQERIDGLESKNQISIHDWLENSQQNLLIGLSADELINDIEDAGYEIEESICEIEEALIRYQSEYLFEKFKLIKNPIDSDQDSYLDFYKDLEKWKNCKKPSFEDIYKALGRNGFRMSDVNNVIVDFESIIESVLEQLHPEDRQKSIDSVLSFIYARIIYEVTGEYEHIKNMWDSGIFVTYTNIFRAHSQNGSKLV